MIEKNYLEAFDAHRPDSDDLSNALYEELQEATNARDADSRLAEVQQQIEQFDRKIIAEADQVPVPAGLEERLLASLEVNEAEKEAAANGSPLPEPVDRAVTEQGIASGRSRDLSSWATSTVAYVAIAAMILVAAGWFLFPSAKQGLSPANIEDFARTWHDKLQQPSTAWQPMDVSPPQEYPTSRHVRILPRGWQTFAAGLDPNAVAYDLSRAARNQQATLLVLKGEVADAGTVPPRQPRSTQGTSIGWWQSGELLYLLVVEGDEDRYRSFIEVQSGIAARWQPLCPAL